jgi:hypothetical protein
MERWAGSRGFKGRVHFVMVSVDPSAERVARKYHNELALENVVVGWCGGREECPRFPAQVGCQVEPQSNGR